MRSPTRILAATTLVMEAMVVFFAGLVAMNLTSLSTGAALGGFGGLALACLVTSGLLRSTAGYVIGSVLQVGVLALALWVPEMLVLGAVFAGLWAAAIVLGRRAEAQAAARGAAVDGAVDGAPPA